MACVNFHPAASTHPLSNNLTFSMHDVNDVVVDPDNGKIYICGYIEAFGAPNAYVLRMNANGSVDTSYHPVVYSSVPKRTLFDGQ